MAPRWVKKRDGRIQPYEEDRIAQAVLRAGRNSGSSEEVTGLAREMARSVTLFLARQPERAPETATIASSLEDALEETGHGQIARAVRDWRDWRRKRQAQVRVREATDGGGERAGSIEVISLRAARPWSKNRIVRELEREAGLEQEAAEEVARAVEERVFAAGLNQISSNLLRELIDAELFERGYSAQLGRLEVLGVPKPDLERLAFLGQGRAPLTLEDRVSRTALERFSLYEIVDGKGAAAHRRGDIHLLGLGRPFRMASGAVCATTVARTPDVPDDPIEAVRRLIRVTRIALTQHDLMFGLVGPHKALAAYADHPAMSGALDVLLEALVTPFPDDLPPAPELVLVVNEPPKDPAEATALDMLVAAFARRGEHSEGVRLIMHVRRATPKSKALVQSLIEGARLGACFDLLLGEGDPLASRGMRPWVGTVQVGLINLAGIALGVGRGERGKFSKRLESAIEAAMEAFHQRRRRVFGSVVRPAFPLFGQAPSETPHTVDPEALTEALGVVGLDASMRYLVGEGISENGRVADLAREVLLEVRTAMEAAATRLGLGHVLLEGVPCGDSGIRLAALDLDRFPEAHALLDDAAGWDTGVALLDDPNQVLEDLKMRMWLARKTASPLVLARPILATIPDAASLFEAMRKAQKATSKVAN